MKLQKPALSDNNEFYYIPKKQENVIENNNSKERENDNLIGDVHMNISVIKNKKKPMLKKFILLENKIEQQIFSNNKSNSEAGISKSILKSIGNESELVKKAEFNKETLNENSIISPNKGPSNDNELVNGIKEDILKNPNINNEQSDEFKNSEVINSEIYDKIIEEENKEVSSNLSNNQAEITKTLNFEENEDQISLRKQIEKNDAEKKKSEAKTIAQENFNLPVEPNSNQESNEDKFTIQANKNTNENNNESNIIQNEVKNETKEVLAYKQNTNQVEKKDENSKEMNKDENLASIKKVKKIEFNVDDDQVEEKEKIIERKSKDLLAKKKDAEKIKALKNKATNNTNTNKPRISVNAAAKKTLNFDEEDE